MNLAMNTGTHTGARTVASASPLHGSAQQTRDLLSPVIDIQNAPDDVLRDIYARVIWSALAEPGDRVAGTLVAQLGPNGALQRASRQQAGESAELIAGRKRWQPRWQPRLAQETLRAAAVAGLQLLTPASTHWPAGVNDLGPHAPLCLWVRGDPARLPIGGSGVAIVGARAATSYGEHVAGELASDLAATGVIVVSGAAYGIDGAAHRAAIGSSGNTVAFLAGGADRAYPRGHTTLIDRIAECGAVVSEVPCGSAPTKWRFLMRNRLIAAMSTATVVVEAGWRSGSLNTAGHAASLARGLGAVPGPVTSSTSAGCHRLIREYGAACITRADDVRELLGISCGAPAPGAEPRTDDRSRVVDALSTRVWRSSSDIAQRAGMSIGESEAQLGLAMLEGDVERGATGWRLVPRR